MTASLILLLPHKSSVSQRQTQYLHHDDSVWSPCPRRHSASSLKVRFCTNFRHSQTSRKLSLCVHHRHSHTCFCCHCRHSLSSHFYSHKQASQVCACRPTHFHIKGLQKKLFCTHCHSQSFCEFCAMGPPLAAASPHKQKLRVLCLHGFRTSGKIMETQLAKMDRSVLDLLDMVFLDGPYPAEGKSDVEGFFAPPYYEWFQFERTETDVKFRHLGECIQFISDFMEMQGPFDGLMGFSQGAFLSGALAGMQQQGLALTSVPALRFVMIISGGVLDGEHPWKGCYSKPIQCPSVHLIGENDFLKPRNEQLLLKFEDPIVFRHAAKHTVPRLDATAVIPIKNFLEGVIAIKEQKEHSSDVSAKEQISEEAMEACAVYA